MTAAAISLADFLLARIAEDEAAARAVKPLENVPVIGGPQRQSFTHGRLSYATEDGYPRRLGDPEAAVHFARHDPARVLAECEAKRRIVDLHSLVPDPEPDDHWLGLCDACDSTQEGYPCHTLQALALPYADHPDYRPEWRA